jgi:hypothetical protein
MSRGVEYVRDPRSNSGQRSEREMAMKRKCCVKIIGVGNHKKEKE